MGLNDENLNVIQLNLDISTMHLMIGNIPLAQSKFDSVMKKIHTTDISEMHPLLSHLHGIHRFFDADRDS